MKQVFCLLCHHSKKFRPKGLEFAKRCLISLHDSVKTQFKTVVIDNDSDPPLKVSADVIVKIDDQFAGGFPEAFNRGIKAALQNDCDMIHLVNDDVILNDSINHYAIDVWQHADKNDALFGPTTNDKFINKCQGKFYSVAKEPKIFKVNTINGFFMTMTSEFCRRYGIDGEPWKMFLPEPKFAGVEHPGFQRRLINEGAKVYVVQSGWFHHRSKKGWQKLETYSTHIKKKRSN